MLLSLYIRYTRLNYYGKWQTPLQTLVLFAMVYTIEGQYLDGNYCKWQINSQKHFVRDAFIGNNRLLIG